MAVQVNPITQSLPATTAIQDPATRRFASAVADVLRTAQSTEFAVQQVSRAFDEFSGGGGTPPAIQQWLLSSELYQKLSQGIERVDIAAKQAIIQEQTDRADAIADEAQSRANEIAAEIAARIAAVEAEASARAAAILSEATARGAAISAEATARQTADDSLAQSITTLTSTVGDNAAAIEAETTARVNALAAEASARNTLAAQMRGSYDGSDLDQVTTGLIFQERLARATAVDGLAQQITLLSAGAGEQFDYHKIWYFDAGAEGWTGNGAPTVSGGWIRPANHASAPYLESPVGIGANGTTHTQVRLRVRKLGSPTWAGFLWWRLVGDSTWDAARRVSINEPSYDVSGIGLATINLPWVGAVDRVRVDLSTAQTASDGYEVDWLAIGRPAPGASSAALLAESQARATADAAEVSAREALSTKVTGVANPASLTLSTLSSGLLYDERQARSAADASEVTARQSLSAKITGFNDPAGKNLVDLTSGLIYEERTARATQDTALASSISTLSVRVGTAEADIVSEATARSNADSAMASQFSALSAQFGVNQTYSVRHQYEFASSLETWGAINSTASVSNGIVTWVTTASNPYFQITFSVANRYLGALATKVRARVRRLSGSAAWEGRCYYRTSAHSASDLYRKQISAPANPSQWTILEWDMSALTPGGTDYIDNDIWAIRLDLVSGAGDTWEIDWVSIGERIESPADFDRQEAIAAITAESTARADADGALTTQINTVSSVANGRNRTFRQSTAPTGATNGDLWYDTANNNSVKRWDGSSWVTTDNTRIASNEAAIVTEATTRSNNDTSIVNAVNTMWAITGATNALSQSGNNIVTNWTTAQANYWSNLNAEVFTSGGQTIRAALQQEATTRANADGSLGAQWTLKTDINGYISGFGFASTANNATPTSEFIIRADKFAVVMPGYGEHVPFAIGDFGPSMFGDGGFSVPVSRLVNQAAQPTSFLETFESGSVAQWHNHSGSGELSVVSVVDSLTGGKVLRIGNNSGNDQAWLIHKQNIPFDPSALYSIKFRVRRTAGTGTVYLGVAGVAADGVTWVNTSGANGYTSQHYVAASNQAPGSSWTEYVGYIKGTAATGQTGNNPPVTAPLKLHQNVKYIRPLILANFSNMAGTLEVDYCSIELMTDAVGWDDVSGSGKDNLVTTASTALTNANAAQTAANTANAALADIAADNKLTPGEKRSVRVEWDAIYAERASIRSQATSFSITTELTNYDNAFQALGTYLNAGTAYTIGATPPSWVTDANLAVTTNIVGSTFRTNWATLYQRRQELLNKIADQAKGASFTPGQFNSITGQITQSNVATWIANAALGNAQIGGDIWSTNHVAGASGWRIYRDGNAEFRNVTVRGDVEASSLKANTAMVGTLNIAGNAVTIPVSASGTTSCQTASTSFEGASVAVVMAVVAQLRMRGVNATGTQIIAYASLYRGASLIKSIEINKAMYGPDDAIDVLAVGTWVLQDTPGSSSTYYRVELSVVGGNSSVLSTSTCSVLALGVKR